MKRQKILILKLIGCLLSCLLLSACLYGKSGQGHVASPMSLEGVVLNVPSHVELELALLALDKQGRPVQLLSVKRFNGNGNALPFQLGFDMNLANQFKAVELRGRLSKGGRLVGYLFPWHKEKLAPKDLKGIILEFGS